MKEAILAKEKIWTRSFINIFLGNFFLFTTFYALLTVLPIYVLDELAGTEIEAGLISTIFLLSAIIVRPFSGKLLGSFGKKRMLLITMGMFMICSFLYRGMENFYLLLALRFFHGIWFSIATTATGAIAADIVPAKRRGEGLGYFVMSTNTAIVAGPFIGLTLLQFISFDALFIVLGAIMIGALFFTAFVKDPTTELVSFGGKLTIDDLFERKSVPVSVVGAFVAFSYASVLSFISIYAKSKGLLEAAGYFYMIFAAVMLISRPFVGRLFDKVGPNVVIYPALGLFAVGLFVLSITDSAMMLFLSAGLIGLGYGTVVPCFQTLAVQSGGAGRSAHATATFFTLFDTGIAVGSYLLGLIASNFGYQKLYITTAVVMIAVVFIYKLVIDKKKKDDENGYLEEVKAG